MKQIVKTSLMTGASLVAVVGLVVAPTFQASADTKTASTTITVNVAKVLSMTSGGAVTINITPLAGGAVTTNSDTVTVSTNSTAGYNLTLQDADATTTLTSGANTMTAMATTWGSPAALTSGKWGYALASGTAGLTAGSNFDASYAVETSSGSSTSKWLGVAASGSPQTLKTTAATATNDTTTVWYGAKADTSQPSGAYVDTVTYTGTTN